MRVQFCVLAVGGALLVAGCGSSNDNLSYSDFGTQASQICKDGTAALNGVNDIKQFGPKIQPFLDKIKALKAPDELKSAQSDFVSITEQQIAAANAGDAKKLQSLQGPSDAAGSKMGAPGCVTGSS